MKRLIICGGLMFSLGTSALALPLPIRNGILSGPLNANRSSITNVAVVAFTDGSVMTTAGTAGFTGTITNLASSSVVLTTNTVTAMVVSGAGTLQDNDIYYPATGFYSHGSWVPFPNSYTNAAGYAVFLRPQLVGPPPGGPWPPGMYVTNPAVWLLDGYKEIVVDHGFGIGTNYVDYGWATNSTTPAGQWDMALLADAPAPLVSATNIVSVIPDQISVLCISGYSNGVCTSLQFATNIEAIPWLDDAATGAAGLAGANGTNGADGDNGTNGVNGTNATIVIATTITGSPGTSASVTNLGTSTAALLQFTIPQGAPGPAGSTGLAGADGTNGTNGTAPAILFTNTITGAPGTSAAMTNLGTPTAPLLQLTIPQGMPGVASGGSGAGWPTNLVTLSPVNGTNFALNVGLTNNFQIFATNNVWLTVSAPSNLVAGFMFTIWVYQVGGGGWPVNYDTNYFDAGSGVYPLNTTTAGAKDHVSLQVEPNGTNLLITTIPNYRNHL